MSITAIMAFLAFLLVLVYFDPNTSGLTGIILFFVTLAPTLIGGLVLGIYAIRRHFRVEPMPALILSGRQGVILGTILVALLVFQLTNILAWWNVGLLLAAGVFLEFYSRVKVE